MGDRDGTDAGSEAGAGHDPWSEAFAEDFVRAAAVKEASAKEREREASKQGKAWQKGQKKQARRSRAPRAGGTARRLIAKPVVFGTLLLIGIPALFLLMMAGIWSMVPRGASTTSSTVRKFVSQDYEVGDCLIWDESDKLRSQTATRTVPCGEPHFIEVFGTVDLNGRFDHEPMESEYLSLYGTDCVPMVEKALGFPISETRGRLGIRGFHPEPGTWAFGNRSLVCGVGGPQRLEPGGQEKSTTITGTVRDLAAAARGTTPTPVTR